MIKWLEGYFISSKFDTDISIQSCSSNLRTPCSSKSDDTLVAGTPHPAITKPLNSIKTGACAKPPRPLSGRADDDGKSGGIFVRFLGVLAEKREEE